MNNKKINKWFTLVEMMISIIIIWLLVILVFKIYIYLSEISVRIENEKILNNELLFMTQTFQNITDKYKIDYDMYPNIKDTYWITKIMYLKWDEWKVKIYSTWDCEDSIQQIKTKHCRVQMEKNWNIVDITDKNKTYFTKLYFKILPYEDNSKFNLNFDDLYHSWIWLFTQIYIKRYSDKDWKFNVNVNFQTFYNIRQY